MKDFPEMSPAGHARWEGAVTPSLGAELQCDSPMVTYRKSWRSLSLHMTEVSALETSVWGAEHADFETRLKVSARGSLDQVITVFEVDGDYHQRFCEVKEITIIPRSAVPSWVGDEQGDVMSSEPMGILFVEFEGLRITGKHPEPALNLHITLDTAKFRDLYLQLTGRVDEISNVSLFLQAELYGDDITLYEDDLSEYGLRRHKDAPSASTPAHLDRVEVVFGKKKALTAIPVPDGPAGDNVVNSELLTSVKGLTTRLGWVIALLAAIIILMLLSSGSSAGGSDVPKSFRQIADLSRYILTDV